MTRHRRSSYRGGGERGYVRRDHVPSRDTLDDNSVCLGSPNTYPSVSGESPPDTARDTVPTWVMATPRHLTRESTTKKRELDRLASSVFCERQRSHAHAPVLAAPRSMPVPRRDAWPRPRPTQSVAQRRAERSSARGDDAARRVSRLDGRGSWPLCHRAPHRRRLRETRLLSAT